MKIILHSALILLLTAGCGKLQETETGSKTNWLSSCQVDSDCSSLSNAICADVCTRACDNNASCDDLGSNVGCRHSEAANQAVCLPPESKPEPGSSGTTAAPVSPSQSASQTPIPPATPCSVDATDPALPGVLVHLEADTCEFASGSGGQFRYSVTGTTLDPFALPASQGCGLCYDASKLSTWTEFKIEGAGIHYCETCDVGCCAPNKATQVSINDATVSEQTINWPGQQWNGPSDTDGKPFGVFAPGDYEAKVSVTLPGVGSIVARLPIVVTD